jgi:hypothetical protein
MSELESKKDAHCIKLVFRSAVYEEFEKLREEPQKMTGETMTNEELAYSAWVFFVLAFNVIIHKTKTGLDFKDIVESIKLAKTLKPLLHLSVHPPG